MKRSLILLVVLTFGALIPEARVFADAIPFLLMTILFFAFFPIALSRDFFRLFFRAKILLLLVLNIAFGFAGYVLFLPFSPLLAYVGFLVGIAPTATAAPSVTSFLRGNEKIPLVSLVLTNALIPIVIALFLTRIFSEGTLLPVTTKIMAIIIIPFFLSRFARYFFPNLSSFSGSTHIAFFAWMMAIFLSMAKASFFLRGHFEESKMLIVQIFAIAFGFCFVHFFVGKKIGGKTKHIEMGQSLGQKNVMLTIWIASSYFPPIVVLGPIFYMIAHNLFNAAQLFLFRHTK